MERETCAPFLSPSTTWEARSRRIQRLVSRWLWRVDLCTCGASVHTSHFVNPGSAPVIYSVTIMVMQPIAITDHILMLAVSAIAELLVLSAQHQHQHYNSICLISY